MRYLRGVFRPLPPGGEEPVDPGILGWVNLLRFHGIETVQSCQGGDGHAYPEPTVDFYGDDAEGWYALSIAARAGEFEGLRAARLNRSWTLQRGTPDQGPVWQLIFAGDSTNNQSRRELLDAMTPGEEVS